MEEQPSEALIVFTPSGKRGRFPIGTPLLQAARQLGVDLDSVCGGRGICGRCKVLLSEGEFAKLGIRSKAEHLSPLAEPEERFARRSGLSPGERLSCHTKLMGDALIDVPAASQLHRQVVRKAYESRDLSVNPLVHLHYVEVDEPRLDRPSGDLQRLLRALAEQWRLADLTCAPHLLPQLQRCLREGEWRLTVAVRERREVVGIWPGFRDRLLGVAVDVGSTTLAAHLCDLASGEVLASKGVANPQIRFGEDLMSRVSYAMLHSGGDAAMTHAVREAVDVLVARLAEQVGASGDEILEMTFVGNPIMHHLLLGISPVELGTAPFALATDGPTTLGAHELDLAVNPGARAYVLPCIAGHVGADAAGVLLAEEPWEDTGVTLLVDVGTNAEIILSGHGRLLAASSPTGPAFEAAQISCGQRAAPGAIERVRIDPETLEPRFRVIGCESWSDEPGFAAEVADVGITGLCGTGIIEAIAELFLAGVIESDGRIDGAFAQRSARVVSDGRTHAYVLHEGSPSLRIVQNDVRAIQLAKASLYAGVRLLMNHLGIEQLDRIRLAGGFGSQIDVKYAMLLGMIPDCALDRVSSAGNAAGTGAVAALLDGDARAAIEFQVRRVEKIEIASEPDFQEHFVAAMALPHGVDRFPQLSKQVALPKPAPPGAATRPRGRSARRPQSS
ncbi:MAG: DUF4445 domain-containing protein [Deltaproteobacteria bacterium]|nr:DUF4445 domain-containing protein [Deltaproteobacteria bacterium]MBW2397775.1 DUF4445 domain-containing protein [Deltaproteobacteria bacterium]